MSVDARNTKRPARIVAVDDDPLVLRMLGRVFQEPNFLLQTAETGNAGLALIRSQRPDIVVLDNVLPDISGLEVLQQLRTFDPHILVLFITAKGTSNTAIEAMKIGAFDFISKPFDLPHLEQRVGQALESRRLLRIPVEVNPSGDVSESNHDVLIGRSHAMQEVYKAIGRATSEDVPLLIQGEPGTGKELVARAVYQHGRRATGPFSVLKCTDYSVELLESELFGCMEGANYSPVTPRLGRLEQNAGGVLLLEDIGDTSPAIQSKLLRFLRDGSFERLGGRESQRANVGLICTTSVDLEQLVADGRFRAELYYLLRSFRIKLPPLRERVDDIPILVDYFVRRLSGIGRALTSDVTRVSLDALRMLVDYSWPGNIDELQSVLRRSLHESKGTVLVSEYLCSALGPTANPHLQSTLSNVDVTNWRHFTDARIALGSESIYSAALEEMERHLLNLMLESTAWNQARAAKMLGITRGNLRKKIRALGLNIPPGAGRNSANSIDTEQDDDDDPPHPEAFDADADPDR